MIDFRDLTEFGSDAQTLDRVKLAEQTSGKEFPHAIVPSLSVSSDLRADSGSSRPAFIHRPVPSIRPSDARSSVVHRTGRRGVGSAVCLFRRRSVLAGLCIIAVVITIIVIIDIHIGVFRRSATGYRLSSFLLGRFLWLAEMFRSLVPLTGELRKICERTRGPQTGAQNGNTSASKRDRHNGSTFHRSILLLIDLRSENP